MCAGWVVRQFRVQCAGEASVLSAVSNWHNSATQVFRHHFLLGSRGLFSKASTNVS